MVKRRGMLRRKLLRDMRENAMQFIAMTLLCFLGTWVFSGLDGTWRLMDLTVETYFEECALSDFWVSASSISPRTWRMSETAWRRRWRSTRASRC